MSLTPIVASAGSEHGGADVKPGERITFDIAAQPLADALYAFSSAAGVEVLVDSAVIEGHWSAGVKGDLEPDAALRSLLAGTRLLIRYTDPGAVTLLPFETHPSARQSPPSPVGLPDPPRYAPYSAAIQAAVKRALCRDGEARPGTYRIAVRLWIDPTGVVARSSLAGSTGDGRRDAAIIGLLQNLSIGEPPPAGLPQPAILLILPRAPRDAADCAVTAGSAAAP